MLLPFLITASLHEVNVHSAMAPVPALPPTRVRVVLPSLQIVEVPEMLVGAVDNVFTVINCEAQSVVLQSPLYLTK